jgi:hypothetical protein
LTVQIDPEYHITDVIQSPDITVSAWLIKEFPEAKKIVDQLFNGLKMNGSFYSWRS